MKEYIIAYDFGTGGVKASLFRADGSSVCFSFEEYPTFYPHVGWHEQKPKDWWDAVCISTKRLLGESGVDPDDIEALAISGHSLVVVPVDKDGDLLRENIPIWSDTRADKEADEFLSGYGYDKWYLKTGNGFTQSMYSVFKLMWYRNHEKEMFDRIDCVLGTKDYINFLLTGQRATDHSYASGHGFYDLKAKAYDFELLGEMGLPREIFPDIVPSTEVIGTLTPKASSELGLPGSVKVCCGGVDNSCMALGARGIADGRVYTSLGSSSWIAVTSHEPILDVDIVPFVFAHVVPDMYASATSIFSAGSTLQWVRDELCRDLLLDDHPFVKMDELAAGSPVGAHKLLLNPSFAGGAGTDTTPNVRGAFIGLDLKHSQADMIRATMEGIAFALRIALDNLKKMTDLQDEMLFVGGGSKSSLWMQMFADIYDMNILRTNIGQDAGSLGAAAIAAVGCGMWKDFSPIDGIHSLEHENAPIPENRRVYEKLFPVYKKATEYLSDIGDLIYNLDI